VLGLEGRVVKGFKIEVEDGYYNGTYYTPLMEKTSDYGFVNPPLLLDLSIEFQHGCFTLYLVWHYRESGVHSSLQKLI